MVVDDIPIQDDQQPVDAPLDSITEEQEDTEKVKKVLKHLPKLSGLTKKHKNKGGDQVGTELNSTPEGVFDATLNDSNFSSVHVSAV